MGRADYNACSPSANSPGTHPEPSLRGEISGLLARKAVQEGNFGAASRATPVSPGCFLIWHKPTYSRGDKSKCQQKKQLQRKCRHPTWAWIPCGSGSTRLAHWPPEYLGGLAFANPIVTWVLILIGVLVGLFYFDPDELGQFGLRVLALWVAKEGLSAVPAVGTFITGFVGGLAKVLVPGRPGDGRPLLLEEASREPLLVALRIQGEPPLWRLSGFMNSPRRL